MKMVINSNMQHEGLHNTGFGKYRLKKYTFLETEKVKTKI